MCYSGPMCECEDEALEITVVPRNRGHFERLMAMTAEVLEVCRTLGVRPLLTGSLAVIAHTGESSIEVHDVDLACHKVDFPRLRAALEARGMACSVTDWHVLQVRRDGLKVEFDDAEFWLAGIPEDRVVVRIAGHEVPAVGLEALKELYRRGLVVTAGVAAAADKHRAIREKLRLLRSCTDGGEPLGVASPH